MQFSNVIDTPRAAGSRDLLGVDKSIRAPPRRAAAPFFAATQGAAQISGKKYFGFSQHGIAGEIARLAATILNEYTLAARRVKDARAAAPDAAQDATEQMQRLLPAHFLLAAPWEALRWMLEELRVSLFAQELRTPQPISVKRLDKAWAQIQG